MTTFNEGLELYQWGRETTRGTLVPATSKMAVERLKLSPIDELVRPRIAKGLMVANPGNETAVKRGMDWEIPDTPVVFNQLQAFLAMALQGGQAPSGVGPYTWTHTRVPTADPALDARTLELRMTDGATPSDWECGYAMCQHIEISGGENELLRFNAKGFARRKQTSTLTAALSHPSIAMAPMALSTVYIDTTFAGLGGTQVAGQVLRWKWMFDTGVKPKATADARTDLDYSTHLMDSREVKMGLEVVVLAQPAGQWATELTAAEAGTLRAVEIRCVSGADSLKLQGLFKHTPASFLPEDFEDGSRIATLRLEGSTDDTNFARSILINSQATMV